MISSISNEKIKNLVHLRKSAKARRIQECFLVEGPRMFFEIPVSLLREVYVTEEFSRKYADRLKGYSYELITEKVCCHLSDTKTPQGVVAVVGRRNCSLEDMTGRDGKACIIVLENLQDPGNMGTVMRTAEAAGVTGIIMNKGTVDPYNPKVIRSTMGAVFRIPFLETEDLAADIGFLKERGIAVYAAHLEGDVFYHCDFSRPCAFLVGNEGNGLTRETASLADFKIRIPMEGSIESLNAGVAASLLMYEAFRQRRWS